MPCASRAAFSVVAALMKALLVMMTMSAAFFDAFSADGALTTTCAGGCTRSSPNAKIVRVPTPSVAKETLVEPPGGGTRVGRNRGGRGVVGAAARTVAVVKPPTVAAVAAGTLNCSALASAANLCG